MLGGREHRVATESPPYLLLRLGVALRRRGTVCRLLRAVVRHALYDGRGLGAGHAKERGWCFDASMGYNPGGRDEVCYCHRVGSLVRVYLSDHT